MSRNSYVTASADLDEDGPRFPPLPSLPLPSNGALLQHGDVADPESTMTLQRGATSTADDGDRTTAASTDQIQSESFNLAASAISSAAVPADAPYPDFLFADIDDDFSPESFLRFFDP